MTRESEGNEDLVDPESGENLTQQRMSEGEDRPAGASSAEPSWGETEDSPHEGEEGTEPVA
ncbi:MAG: hypothetical protein H0U03_10715 [Actinobacteria bacterium]|nr:hypothetical protein [Actinomycetota bacterium]